MVKIAVNVSGGAKGYTEPLCHHTLSTFLDPKGGGKQRAQYALQTVHTRHKSLTRRMPQATRDKPGIRGIYPTQTEQRCIHAMTTGRRYKASNFPSANITLPIAKITTPPHPRVGNGRGPALAREHRREVRGVGGVPFANRQRRSNRYFTRDNSSIPSHDW